MKQPSLEYIRHTLAHLLAAVVVKKYPHAKLTLGPAIENGFYYDIDFSGSDTPSDSDLMKLENLMRNVLPSWTTFTHKEVLADEARAFFAGNPYKLELINEIVDRGEKITLYTAGDFTDLCRGGHCENPAEEIAPDSFSLDKIAGAYWRGSEKNPMLTRIYGLAFASAKELEEYRTQQEEAKKRDHRILNEKHDYFMISEDVGKGLPLYLPNGAYIRKKLEDFMYEKELSHGYKYVYTPVLTHKRLYEQSGHLAHYHEDMYSPITIEDEEYYLRPMNCPHHHQIYKHKPVSYRDLPLRLAEFGLVHRFERSGVLTGLIRARCFTQNDAHIYCSKQDLKKELLGVLTLFREVYDGAFGIKDYWFRLSLPDFSNAEKFGDVENKEMWDEATESARAALNEFGAHYVEGGGEAAFYGPKIDVQIRNVNGKEDTIATVQVDFYSADRFNLEFTNNQGQKEKPVIVHRAIMGSFERFFAFLIEQYAGAFPTWLSPVQVMILPVSDKHNTYAKEIARVLLGAGIQILLDDSKDTLGKKVRSAKGSKAPYFIVIGDKEVELGTVTIENRNGEKLDVTSVDTFLSLVQNEISTHEKKLISKEKTNKQ
jgi:threonyl-tRNA synthetase